MAAMEGASPELEKLHLEDEDIDMEEDDLELGQERGQVLSDLDEYYLNNPDANTTNRKRNEAIREIIESEATYVAGLEKLVNIFYNPIRLTPRSLLMRRSSSRDVSKSDQRIIANEDIQTIFGNVDTLLNFHQQLLKNLRTRYNESNNGDPNIGDIFSTIAPFFKMYVTYLNNYQYALATLSRCQKQNQDFRDYLARVHKDPTLSDLNIVAYLILPIQRIPRYRMLLEAVVKYTPTEHEDYDTLLQALESVVVVADQVNENIRSAENAQKVVEIQNLLGPSLEHNLVTPSRRFLHAGELFKISRHAIQKRICYLFNDILVYAREVNFFRLGGAPVASGESYQYKGTINLDCAWVHDLTDIKAIEHGFLLVCPNKTYTFNAINAAQKEIWMKKINSAIDALVAKSPELISKREEIKLPQVTGLYKHFTIQLDQIMNTENSAGASGELSPKGTAEVDENGKLIRKLSKWGTKSLSKPKEGGATPPPLTSSSSSSSLRNDGNNTSKSQENKRHRISDVFIDLPPPQSPPADLASVLSSLPAEGVKNHSATIQITQPRKPSGISYKSRPLPPTPQKKAGSDMEEPSSPKPIIKGTDSNGHFLVRAIWDNEADAGDELTFHKGEIITIINTKDNDWWQGKLHGKIGWVPSCYVQKIGDRIQQEKIGEALWDYSAKQPEELSFTRGELIKILWDRDPHWCQGERLGDGEVGWFPSNLVVVSDDEDSD